MVSDGFIHQERRWVGAGRHDCVAENGMVASKHLFIGEAGVSVMRKGGNAVDAAVAAAFMDCVVEPAMNGIGGEGVMAIHLESGENVIVDYVGRPSVNCTPDIYELEEAAESGWMGWRKVKDDANVVGHKACTTPGTVAGLTEALERYGTMSLEEVMAPAIKVAREGFTVGWWTADHIFRRMEGFWGFDEWRRVYLREGQFPYLPYFRGMAEPHVLVNEELAKCLEAISMEGRDAFYKGWIAGAIAGEMERGGGLVTLEDLAMYEPIINTPDPGSYRGLDVVFDPTHSGTTMMQILNIMEGYDFSSMGFMSPERLHVVAESVGLAFADRFKYMGDPGFVEVPLKGLVSKEYATELRGRIDHERAGAVKFGDPWPHEPECTTALAVADKAGNMVCVNQTLVNSFGCGVVVPGTGIVMNNAMYGLDPEPGHANSIDGRKRRIQNVCPTVLLDEGEPFMVLGAPGGRNIQVSVAQVIHHVVDYGMGAQDAVDAPRITRETGTVYLDSRYPAAVRDRLTSMGHDINWIDPELKSWGRPVAVVKDMEDGLLHGGVYSMLTGFESMAVGF
ncbi:MAG TPA: gamma-glutamyltransferase [Candidatus Krumholzibacteriaceae bacterium]|nr:gamma-glutamyltransferase [Candidatus Krumholzibacteriaceae bacterium]